MMVVRLSRISRTAKGSHVQARLTQEQTSKKNVVIKLEIEKPDGMPKVLHGHVLGHLGRHRRSSQKI